MDGITEIKNGNTFALCVMQNWCQANDRKAGR